MNVDDKNNFAAMLSATMQTYLQPLTGGMIDVWWNVLTRHEFVDVRKAMSDHIQDPDVGRFPPKPADILGRVRSKGAAYQPVPQLEDKRKGAAPSVWPRLAKLIKPRPGGRWWVPERVTNQQQVNFIKVQADRFGENSMQGRFLRQCQNAGIITADFQLGVLNQREPGEDETETEEAA